MTLTQRSLTEDDFRHAADLLGCSVAAIKAVAEVEAPKGGFNQDGSPVTLFEAHQFSKFTDGRFDEEFPNLSGPTWDRSKYGVNWHEEGVRLGKAVVLDREAALKATSWGKFQVMGMNYELAGYEDLEVFITDMHKSEREHLFAFVAYVRNTGIDDEIREQRWAAFARKYNGPAFAQNRYDVKMAEAFAKYSEHA